jgi:type II secretory pathway component GspD/PulD (secretin)
MRKKISLILCSAALLTVSAAMAQQPGSPANATVPTTVPNPPEPGSVMPPAPAAATTAPAVATTTEAPAPIEPPVTGPAVPGIAPTPSGAPAPGDQAVQSGTSGADTTGTAAPSAVPFGAAASGHALNEFQGDDVAQVLRLLARQSKISLVVSDKISDAQPPMKVTMRLEDKTPMEAIKIIVFDKGLILLQKDGVYYVKTKEEKEAEPTESAFYTFSYAAGEKVLPLLAAELESHVPPQYDPRTNTVFYREVGSNLDAIKLFLATVDTPTKQVMIEARLLEVTANPQQSYGFNWGGVVGNSSSPQSFTYGGSTGATYTINDQTNPTTGTVNPIVTQSTVPTATTTGGAFSANSFLLNAQSGVGGLLRTVGGQFAILSVPQMTLTMRFLNEDADAELLANPRIVTADNQQATIKITRNQPVPQLNFNEQTAQAVFGGFQDKNYGNTLTVTPSINKDNFVTLNVKPEISNKVADSVFTFSGATVSSPVIDTRDIESTVLIKSGDTLAIGGLLQDEVNKTHNKVPVLGDLPVIGYAFQEHVNARTKRNLLIFVTPTIIKQGYGTGLEDQVNGLHHSGEEYADPNGWRNNASGAYRLVPTSRRQIAADYPKPGVPTEPVHNPDAADVDYRASASGN